MALYSERKELIGSENAFRMGSRISAVEAQGEKVLRLNIGEPDFPIPQCVTDEVKRQLDLHNTHYCEPRGLLSLRKAIVRQVLETRHVEYSPEQVVVLAGVKPAIAFAEEVYCQAGDEIIYPSPGYPIYESFVRYVGAVPRPLHLREENDFTFTAGELEELITERTKLIILNFPSNPTGGVAGKKQIEEIAAVIMKKCGPDVRVLSDEIYEYILFDGLKNFSIASVPGMKERTILCSGFSKTFAWTGGRLGYAVLPTQDESDVFRNMNINYYSCLPAYNQEGAREAFENPASLQEVRKMVAEFEERRNATVSAMQSIPGLSLRKPGGAFYLFPNIQGICERLDIIGRYQSLKAEVRERTSPSTLFQMFMLYVYRVGILDRKSFGRIGSEGKHFVRISLASERAQLREGVERLRQAAADKEGFARFFDKGENLI